MCAVESFGSLPGRARLVSLSALLLGNCSGRAARSFDDLTMSLSPVNRFFCVRLRTGFATFPGTPSSSRLFVSAISSRSRSIGKQILRPVEKSPKPGLDPVLDLPRIRCRSQTCFLSTPCGPRPERGDISQSGSCSSIVLLRVGLSLAPMTGPPQTCERTLALPSYGYAPALAFYLVGSSDGRGGIRGRWSHTMRSLKFWLAFVYIVR